jgi:hypothetical protein
MTSLLIALLVSRILLDCVSFFKPRLIYDVLYILAYLGIGISIINSHDDTIDWLGWAAVYAVGTKTKFLSSIRAHLSGRRPNE